MNGMQCKGTLKKVNKKYKITIDHSCVRNLNSLNNEAAKMEMIRRCLVMTKNLIVIFNNVRRE